MKFEEYPRIASDELIGNELFVLSTPTPSPKIKTINYNDLMGPSSDNAQELIAFRELFDTTVDNIDESINASISTLNSQLREVIENSGLELHQQLTQFTLQKIADLVGGASSTMDTLREIEDAITQHKAIVEILNNAIGTKASAAEFDTHVGDTVVHTNATERTKWNRSLSLRPPNKIALNTDLNDILEPGSYYAPAGSTSSTLPNAPYSDTGFLLYVIYSRPDLSIGNGRYIQYAIKIVTGEIMVRTRTATTWSEWELITIKEAERDKWNASLQLGLMEEIVAGKDLNDYVDPGSYYIRTSTNSTAIANSPFSSSGGIIYVFDATFAANYKRVVQFSLDVFGNIQERNNQNNTWSSWKLINPEAGAHLELEDGKFRLEKYCTIVTDWNEAITNGFYVGYKALNAPSDTTNWLYGFVIAHNSANVRQILYEFAYAGVDGSNRQERMLDRGTWTKWKRIYVDYEAGEQLESVGKKFRLAKYCTTITDWNDATESGFYQSNKAANSPYNGYVFGIVISRGADYCRQIVYKAALYNTVVGSTKSASYERIKDRGEWGNWQIIYGSRVLTQAEYDALKTNGSIDNNIIYYIT